MKKLILIILSLFLLLGCTAKQQEEKKEVLNKENDLTDEEKCLQLIQECIQDYNEGDIDELQAYWNTTIPPKPINIGEITQIESLSDLREASDEEKGLNAAYSYVYDLGDYDMIINLHRPLLYFWQDGIVEFDIDLDAVNKNDPQFSSEKAVLDDLFSRSSEVLHLLYAVDVNMDENDCIDDEYYHFISYNGKTYETIDDIKAYAETVFSSDYLEELYKVAFEGNDPLYKEIDGKLYCAISNSNIYSGLAYDTSMIIATQYADDMLDIDILITMGDTTINKVKRICLRNEGSGYRFTNAY